MRVTSLDFWIAVAVLFIGGTLASAAVEQSDLGAKVIFSVVAGMMVFVGVVFVVDYLRDRRKGGQHVD